MKIERRVHDRDGVETVRFHVVDPDGRCVPEACVGGRGLCGYTRRYQAVNAATAYRRDLAAIEAAGARW